MASASSRSLALDAPQSFYSSPLVSPTFKHESVVKVIAHGPHRTASHPSPPSPSSSNATPASSAVSMQNALDTIRTNLDRQKEYVQSRRHVLSFATAAPPAPAEPLYRQHTTGPLQYASRNKAAQLQSKSSPLANAADREKMSTNSGPLIRGTRSDFRAVSDVVAEQAIGRSRPPPPFSSSPDSKLAYDAFVVQHLGGSAARAGTQPHKRAQDDTPHLTPHPDMSGPLATSSWNYSPNQSSRTDHEHSSEVQRASGGREGVTSPTFKHSSSSTSSPTSASLAYSKAFRAKVLLNLSHQPTSAASIVSPAFPSNILSSSSRSQNVLPRATPFDSRPLNIFSVQSPVAAAASHAPLSHNVDRPNATTSPETLKTGPLNAYAAVQRTSRPSSDRATHELQNIAAETRAAERELSPRRQLGIALPWQLSSSRAGEVAS